MKNRLKRNVSVVILLALSFITLVFLSLNYGFSKKEEDELKVRLAQMQAISPGTICKIVDKKIECKREEKRWSREACLYVMSNRDKDGCPDTCSQNGPACNFNKKFAHEEYVGKEKRGENKFYPSFPCEMEECIYYRTVSTWKYKESPR